MLSQKGRLADFAQRPEKITLPNMMKSIRTLLVTQTVLALGGLAFANTNSLVTFDELTPTASGLAVPANYASLNWSNFFYIDGVNYAGNPSGFQAGVVSSNNVAYNAAANPAGIVGGLFDLNSAYLTAGWNDNLEVEAKGYIGGVLSYDQTYSLSATARTLIQFNYLGVDQVDFVSSGGSHHAGYGGTGTNFVMDNVDLTLYIPSSTSGLVQNGGFESGTFTNWIQSGNLDSTYVVTDAQFVHSGTYGALLGPAGALGFISQTLPTTPGASYVLSFWLDNPDCPDCQTNNEFLVSWNGATLFDQINLPALGWTNLQFSVTATGATAIVQFGFQDDPSFLGLDDISLAPPVSVQFTASPTNGTVPLTVQFSSPSADSGGQALTRWNWDFGDGSSSTEQNPSHLYARPATFSPSLIATNSSGMTDYGGGPSIVVSLPTVQFTASAARGQVPLSVQFTSPSVDSAGNAITNREWDFGDGSPHSPLQNPSHIYATNGTFANGLLVISANVGPRIRADGPAPITTWFPSGGKVGELVENGGFETAFSGWTKSGNEASTLLGTGPLYVHSGTNGAKLGPVGTLGFISQTLATTPGASYVLSFWLDSPAGLTTNEFPNEFLVSWNDDTLFDQVNLPAIGWTNLQFSVTATSTTGVIKFGFQDDPSDFGLDDISVAPPVSLQFGANPTNGTAPLTVQFISPGVDNEGHTLTSWNWNFGDGATNSAPNPAHTYTGGGTFFPFLIATNDTGVTDIANGPAIVVRQLLPVRLTDPHVTGSAFSFSFLTVSNNSYTVWRKADLTSATWINYSNFIADGYVKQISVATTNAAQFFRVSQP